MVSSGTTSNEEKMARPACRASYFQHHLYSSTHCTFASVVSYLIYNAALVNKKSGKKVASVGGRSNPGKKRKRALLSILVAPT
jgi:hypothetical protein